ncbi:hypothetical protein NLU03_31275 [Bacillus toyonensis]|nr:hypothetical protein [Bacillus toyonensis]
MSDHGRYSLRGYKVQTVVSLLKALQNNLNWKEFSIEPKDEAKEVDVYFEKTDGSELLIQVKSTKNKFTAKQAHDWLQALKSGYKGCRKKIEYKLVLVGDAEETIYVDEIEIIALDLKKMNEEVCRLLKNYYKKHFPSEPSDDAVNTLVDALCNIAEGDTINAKAYTRDSFIQLLEYLNSTVVQVERLNYNTYKNLKLLCEGLEYLVKNWNLKPQLQKVVTKIDADFCDFENLIKTIQEEIRDNSDLYRDINEIEQGVSHINGMLRQIKSTVQGIEEKRQDKERKEFLIDRQEKLFKGWQEDKDFGKYISSIEEFILFAKQKYGVKLN